MIDLLWSTLNVRRIISIDHTVFPFIENEYKEEEDFINLLTLNLNIIIYADQDTYKKLIESVSNNENYANICGIFHEGIKYGQTIDLMQTHNTDQSNQERLLNFINILRINSKYNTDDNNENSDNKKNQDFIDYIKKSSLSLFKIINSVVVIMKKIIKDEKIFL
jgi:hypothetical protein